MDITLGGVLQNLQPDGRPIWTLRVGDNAIVVSCTKYERWEDISSKALDHIQAAIAFVNNDSNAVTSLIHQIVDRFVTANKDEYYIRQVFNTQHLISWTSIKGRQILARISRLV